MMKFQNTERLTVSERLEVVSNEILEIYPKLRSDDVLKIASLCDVISDHVECDDIFRRYYYILLIIQDDRTNFDVVYQDMRNVCNQSLREKLNQYLFRDIEKYYDGVLDNFPMISDYYGNEE